MTRARIAEGLMLLVMGLANGGTLTDPPEGWQPHEWASHLVTVQIAGLLQLALRHPGIQGDIRQAGLDLLDDIRGVFAGAPAVLEILRRGDLPEHDQ